MLGELAELGLAFARELKAQVAAVKSVDEAERLALAFHRVARSVRLALALRVRLARERHELGLAVRRTDDMRSSWRKHQIRTFMAREIRAEADRETAGALIERLDERLAEDALFERLLDGPLEAAIARIREDLGLAANDAGPASDPAAPPPDEAPAPDTPRADAETDAPETDDDFWSAPWRSSA